MSILEFSLMEDKLSYVLTKAKYDNKNHDSYILSIPNVYNGLPVKKLLLGGIDSSFKEVNIPENIESIEPYFSVWIEKFVVAESNDKFASIDGVLYDKKIETLICYPHERDSYLYELPSTVKRIDSDAFPFGFDYLAHIEVEDINDSFSSEEGILFDKKKERLIRCPSKNRITNYSIPKTVKIIEDGAFIYCENLSRIAISRNVTHIKGGAFFGCKNLKTVIISENANIIFCGNGHFEETPFLTNYSNIKNGVFYIRNTVLSVVDSNISCCKIWDGINYIAELSFYELNNLHEISLPKSLNSFSPDIFYECLGIISVNVDRDNQNICSIDGVVFDKDVDTLIYYPSGKTNSRYVVPNGVRKIGGAAFSDATALEEIVLPNTITYIGKSAFSKCSFLDTIYFCGSEQEWNRIEKEKDWNYLLKDYSISFDF